MKDTYKKTTLFLISYISAFYQTGELKAELSYNFTTKQFLNGPKKASDLSTINNEKNTTISFDSQNKLDEHNSHLTENLNNEVKIKIGGLVETQYYYIKQLGEYYQDILANGHQKSFAEINNNSVLNDNKRHVINMLGKIDINPEFNRYKNDDITNKKTATITAGAKISQPFYNSSKNTDPRMASQEYIYLKTKYLRFQMGAVNSSASHMRVDPQKIASGAGGVYGTWWRYVSLPVFNTTNISAQNANALNLMSPVYILYPTLPNEAGFTTQRVAIGRTLYEQDFQGIVKVDNLINGSISQGYPTQGAYSNKISMYTTRVKGISFGISYSPTTANTGFITNGLNKNTQTFANISGGFVKNYTSLALDYRKQIDKYGLGIALSLTYEYGEASPLKYTYTKNNASARLVISDNKYYSRHNLNAFAIGAQLVYKNYSIAYSYGYWGHSLLNRYTINTAGKYQIISQYKRSYYHTVGMGANYGPIRIGMTYMHSSFAGYKLDAWSVGTDFKMISLKYLRVQPYFEYVGYIFHTYNISLIAGSNSTYKASANRGYIITIGIRVVF